MPRRRVTASESESTKYAASSAVCVADNVEVFVPLLILDLEFRLIILSGEKETGLVFSKVLEHAGVYKCNQEGLAAFERFIAKL